MVEVVLLQSKNCKARGRLKQHQDLSIVGQAGICKHVKKLNIRRNKVPISNPNSDIKQPAMDLTEAEGPIYKTSPTLPNLTRGWREGEGQCVGSLWIESQSKIASPDPSNPPWHGCASTAALESSPKRNRSRICFLVLKRYKLVGLTEEDNGGWLTCTGY